MDNQFFQVKLAFDVVLDIVGLLNVCKYFHWFLTFSTRLWAEISLSYRVPDPISKFGSTVIVRHFTALGTLIISQEAR